MSSRRNPRIPLEADEGTRQAPSRDCRSPPSLLEKLGVCNFPAIFLSAIFLSVPLVTDGVLEIVVPGSRASRKATRYRYLLELWSRNRKAFVSPIDAACCLLLTLIDWRIIPTSGQVMTPEEKARQKIDRQLGAMRLDRSEPAAR